MSDLSVQELELLRKLRADLSTALRRGNKLPLTEEQARRLAQKHAFPLGLPDDDASTVAPPSGGKRR